MKKIVKKLSVFGCILSCMLALIFLVGCEKADKNKKAENAKPVENLFVNGDFSSGIAGWGVYMEQNGNGILGEVEGTGTLSVKNTGKVDYSVQLYYDGFALKEGGMYEISFDGKSTIPRNGLVRIQLNSGDYHAYFEEKIKLSSKMEHFVFRFPMTFPSDIEPRFCFNFGTPKDEAEIKEHVITLDNVVLALVDGSKIVAEKEVIMPDINLDQVGYLTKDNKKAILRGENLGDAFQVIDESGAVVFEGKLTGPIKNITADEVNYYGDFSNFTTPGTYTIASGDAVASYPFVISDGVYDELMKSTVKMLYLQRCGQALDKELAGDFAHKACHISEATVYGTNEKKEVSGGWHDAGDYGRYVSPGAITVADLFLAMEDFPEVFTGDDGDAYGIPESGNKVPDILDEARYELEWMLKMQDEKTGGVYHKVTCKAFPGFIFPDEEAEELVLSPISTTATGAFAAIMAKSSVIYKNIDSTFAQQCLEAAKIAWIYLENNKNTGGFKNPSTIVTGEYGDTIDSDERYWAAAELFNATNEKKYGDYIEQLISEATYQGYGWADVGTYGNIACLRLPKGSLPEKTIQLIQDSVIQEADKHLALSMTDGYGISLGNDYMWGSNMAVCNYARQMILANELNPKKEYLDAVVDHFHYLLGANPMSICYVSGFGTISPQYPHHRMSSAVGKAMPGMLIGGPDSGLHDPYMEKHLKNVPPAKCYVDNEQSYSTNEITIYWNSPFIYLLAKMISK